MTVRLRPIRDDEFPAFIEDSRAGYADDVELNGSMTREEAQAKAVRDFASLFPGDRPAKGQIVLVVEYEGEALGRVWFTVREGGGRKIVWLYDITIAEQARGRGFGREAMLLLEQEARDRGASRIELNVFAGNFLARSLYRSLGYLETSVWMGKDVG